MATFEEFYHSLPEDSNQRGEVFERIFIPWFLRTDPEWSTKVKEIWLWDEYPERWGKDCGIDLVYEDQQGNHWAVQSKCISPDREISKAEIDSFLSESNDARIHGRLLIASTDGIGKNALQVIERQEKQVVCFLREHFCKSEVIFPSSVEDLSTGRRKERRAPRPHQKEAIQNVVAGLQTEERGQLLMACGTGKTLTSLWIKEALNSKRTLVLLPSLSLLSQTLREWTATSQEEFDWICVCSDKSVAKQDKSTDNWIENVSELGVPVTSDPSDIRCFLQSAEEGIVFSTYQSSPLVAEAQKTPETPAFDIAFADEAHRCAGKVSTAFGCILDSQRIRAEKRLFMTATPRILSTQVKKNADEEDIEIASMDNVEQFGRVFHKLYFSEAIKRDLLTDYRVVVVGVDDPNIQAKIINRQLSSTDTGIETDFETLANHISLAKAIQEYNLKRVITFHGRVKAAQKFSSDHIDIIDWITPSSEKSRPLKTGHVSGDMSSMERHKKINQLRNLEDGETGILSNARCLSEGVDVPTLDGIAFIDPRSSQVDIIQAVGRVIRKSASKGYGYIILPVYLGNTDDPEEKIHESRFKDIWQIILALRSQDDSISQELDSIRLNLGRRKKSENHNIELKKIIIDMPSTIGRSVVEEFKIKIVQETTSSWHENYGSLLKYLELNPDFPNRNHFLGRWIGTQRAHYKNNTLREDRAELLERVDNWSWDPRETIWNDTFKKVLLMSEKLDDSKIPQKDELGSWISNQRQSYKNNKLTQIQIQKLESLPKWTWNADEEYWQTLYKEVVNYQIMYKNCSPQQKTRLGKWISTQRTRYKSKMLESYKIELLENIQGWSWNTKDDYWNERFEELRNHAINHGTCDIADKSSGLQRWISTQRKNYKNNILPNEKIDLLESLNDWHWDNNEYTWKMNLIALKEYIQENGHANPERKLPIGKWVSQQRLAFNKNKLESHKIAALEDIQEWGWTAQDADTKRTRVDPKWMSKINELNAFFESENRYPKHRESSLGSWISTQRKNYKDQKLHPMQIEILEKTPGWQWNIK